MIDVAPRLAARMIPAKPKQQWLAWDDIAEAFRGRPDPDWDRDRNLIDQSVASPWDRPR
jgi:hypothetical protein